MLVAQRLARETGGGQARRLDVDRQFLRQFADERLLGRFAGFDLAAGKFPQPRHRPPFGAPLHEQPAIAVNERRSDHDETVLRGIIGGVTRSEEHTSELQSLMRISYAVFCLKKKNIHKQHHYTLFVYTVQTYKY